MRVKNVSSTNIPLPEFNLNLKPGDIGDLTGFDQKVIHTHKLLAAYFQKGLLVNLGLAPSPTGSKKSMQTARDRIAQLKIGEYISKPATKSQSSNRNKIMETLKKNDSRAPVTPEFDPSKERYHDEYYANMNPGQQVERPTQPKPRPKIDETFRPMQINYDDTISEFGSYGTIATEVLTGPTTYLQQSLSIPQKQDNVVVKDIAGNEYNVSLKNIKEGLERRCIGANKAGKPCGKWAIRGLNSCATHLSRSEKKEYEELKRNGKLDSSK